MKELKEFEKWLEEVREDEKSQFPFVWELMKSPYVEYHYALMKDKSLSDKFRKSLMSRFDEHHQAAETFLLSKLDNNEDSDFHAEIIYILGKLNDRKNNPRKEKVLSYARQLTLSPDAYIRDRAIIVLGWIGTEEDIPLLADRLLYDVNEKCRAWAATSFMQMWFRNKSEQLVAQVLPFLRQSIEKENNYFALGCMIEVVQEITKKRFGLVQKSIDNLDKEKIEEAKSKAQRYFKKLYTE